KFIPDPFSEERGARLYRSGDVVRYRRAGELEFIGRADDQVKVRGHRVELGEVEAALREVAEVSEAAVILRGAEAGEQQLVGYVLRGEGELSEVELRARLRARLPDYMVPAVVIKLEQMPLNHHGKIDRHALPDPDGFRPQLNETLVEAETPIEKMLAAIWAEALGIEKVGVRDNFFELGGQSLLAAQVMGQLRAGLNIELPAYDLFENP